MKIKPQFRLKPPKHKKQKEQNNQMPLPDHGLVIVTQQNKKWLRMSKESYHWMISVGIDPTKKKWNRRMIGREVPAKWFR